MDANHQDQAGSKLIAPTNKLWLPQLSPKDQQKLTHLRENHFVNEQGFLARHSGTGCSYLAFLLFHSW